VVAGATAGGDGSVQLPMATIAEAIPLAMPWGRPLCLSDDVFNECVDTTGLTVVGRFSKTGGPVPNCRTPAMQSVATSICCTTGIPGPPDCIDVP
jgi:hypothetical protein